LNNHGQSIFMHSIGSAFAVDVHDAHTRCASRSRASPFRICSSRLGMVSRGVPRQLSQIPVVYLVNFEEGR
jgi:hypothetical protein